MKTRLDSLLAVIHPERTLNETRRRADEALNSFPLAQVRITVYHEFVELLVRFLIHADVHLLRLSAPMEASTFAWERVQGFVRGALGAQGVKAAFEMSRTGNEGGLRRVLRTLIYHVADEYAGNEIAARVHGYWNHLSIPEKFAAADEYLAKYGHLLPSELTEGSAARIRADLPKVLIEHPRLLQRLEGVGRR